MLQYSTVQYSSRRSVLWLFFAGGGGEGEFTRWLYSIACVALLYCPVLQDLVCPILYPPGVAGGD